jgi:hypothetical protein
VIHVDGASTPQLVLGELSETFVEDITKTLVGAALAGMSMSTAP